MKNRKLNQLLVAGMISAAMMTSGISVQAADFSDDTSTVEEQSVGSAEEEAPEVEDGSEFQSDAAEASSAVAVSSANFPDAKFRQYVLDNIDTDKDKKLSAAEIKACGDLRPGEGDTDGIDGTGFWITIAVFRMCAKEILERW